MSGGPHHHADVATSQPLVVVAVVLVALIVATGYGLWRAGRPGAGVHHAVAVLGVAVLWLVVDPIHAPTIFTFLRSHAVTPGDLLVLPALAVAGLLLGRDAGPTPAPPSAPSPGPEPE